MPKRQFYKYCQTVSVCGRELAKKGRPSRAHINLHELTRSRPAFGMPRMLSSTKVKSWLPRTRKFVIIRMKQSQMT